MIMEKKKLTKSKNIIIGVISIVATASAFALGWIMLTKTQFVIVILIIIAIMIIVEVMLGKKTG